MSKRIITQREVFVTRQTPDNFPLYSGTLLRSVCEIAELLKEMFNDMLMLPQASTVQFLPVIEGVVNRYLQKTREVYTEMTQDCLSASMLNMQRDSEQVMADPFFQALRPEQAVEHTVGSFFSQSDLFKKLLDKAPQINSDQLMKERFEIISFSFSFYSCLFCSFLHCPSFYRMS